MPTNQQRMQLQALVTKKKAIEREVAQLRSKEALLHRAANAFKLQFREADPDSKEYRVAHEKWHSLAVKARAAMQEADRIEASRLAQVNNQIAMLQGKF